MKKVELIVGSLALLGLIPNFFAVKGGAFLSIISLTAIALMYFYLGFILLNEIPLKGLFKKVSYWGISTMRLIGSIGTRIALSLVVSGIMFTTFH